jgi:putative spermidine/putrescine transport system substrate-binding protein
MVATRIDSSRRRITVGAAVAGTAAAAGLARPSGAHAQRTESEVVLAGYGGTYEQFTRNQLIPGFEKATGIRVRLLIGTALSNYSKVVASRNAPEIDVYWANELTHAAGKQQGLYERLDPGLVTHLADVFPSSLDPDGIGVGSHVQVTGFQYNTQRFREAGIPAPTSWNDLWDPRLKGRVALYTFSVAFSQDLLVLLTKLAGGTERDVRPGLERLKALKASGNLAFFPTSPAELDNMLVQGQAWIAVNGGPRAYILKDRGAPIDFAVPREGGGYFTNYFDVVRNAPRPRAAQQLVDYLIGPEAQLVIARDVVAAPVNRKVVVPAELAGRVPVGEDQLGRLIRIDRVEMNRQLDAWADLWNRELEGRR